MSLFGDIFGFIDTGRAAAAVSNANIAAEHGVLGATAGGQADIHNAIDTGQSGIASAGAGVGNAVGGANSLLSSVANNETTNLQPYLSAGQQGATSLAEYAASKPQFSFSPSDLQNDPGYQFQLQQGRQAVLNGASTTGYGGNTLKALTELGQGLAGTYYNQAFQRAQQQFQTNQSTTLANLQALTGVGQVGTQQYQNAVQNAGNLQSQNTVGGANTIAGLSLGSAGLGLQGSEASAGLGLKGATTAGDFAVGAGQARGAGILGQGNSLTGIAGDVGGLLTNPALGLVP